MAIIATLGCALPLILSLLTRNPGFFWATMGACTAAQAHPLQRLGMPGMLLLILLGAASIALGFWADSSTLSSLSLFAGCGLLLAWLQRYGNETGKLGVTLAICFCIGQSQYGLGHFDNPCAIAALFVLGGLWVSLLGFSLRLLYALPLWPDSLTLRQLGRIMKRQALRMPPSTWWLYALACLLSSLIAGLCLLLLPVPREYWLTVPVYISLHLCLQPSLLRILSTGLAMLAVALVLIAAGFYLANAQDLMLAILIPLLLVLRAFQAKSGDTFALQTGLCFLLVTEAQAQDWYAPEWRLINVCIGLAISLGVTFSLQVFWQVASFLRKACTGISRPPL